MSTTDIIILLVNLVQFYDTVCSTCYAMKKKYIYFFFKSGESFSKIIQILHYKVTYG